MLENFEWKLFNELNFLSIFYLSPDFDSVRLRLMIDKWTEIHKNSLAHRRDSLKVEKKNFHHRHRIIVRGSIKFMLEKEMCVLCGEAHNFGKIKNFSDLWSSAFIPA